MELKNGQYLIQQKDPEQIAQQYGLPLFIYDGNIIKEKVNRLKNAFSGLNYKIKYAIKASTNISLIKYLQSLGCGVDTVSINEVKIALKCGARPEQILFTPNSVPFREIEEGIEHGVLINIDNLSILEKFGKKYGDSVPCCLRINPHVIGGGNFKIQTGHGESKFGISVELIEDIYQIVEKYNIKVKGLHVHTGSDILDIESFMESARRIMSIGHHFNELTFIDFGSGFKVPYKPDDKYTDIEALARQMKKEFQMFCEDYGKEIEIWFEPGKYLVSEAGILLVETSVLKRNGAVEFAGVNSGQNHLIRPMMYDAYHEIINISNPEGKIKPYAVVGYICETDTFAWQRPLNEVREGDILAIKNAGAYCFSMSNNYNSRFRPPEVLIKDGETYLIREREKLEDLIKHQVVWDF